MYALLSIQKIIKFNFFLQFRVLYYIKLNQKLLLRNLVINAAPQWRPLYKDAQNKEVMSVYISLSSITQKKKTSSRGNMLDKPDKFQRHTTPPPPTHSRHFYQWHLARLNSNGSENISLSVCVFLLPPYFLHLSFYFHFFLFFYFARILFVYVARGCVRISSTLFFFFFLRSRFGIILLFRSLLFCKENEKNTRRENICWQQP